MPDLNLNIGWRKGLLAVSPIIVFLLVYLVTSLIIGDFYKMPLSVAFLIASVWAAFTLHDYPLKKRIEVFSEGAASLNVLYMIWIFILAGAFAAIAKSTGAVESTVSLAFEFLPPSLIVPGLFITTCFISMAIGTSVGTVVALTPLAVDMAMETNGATAYFVAIVLGGAFFGDNLSFISDTTIAATRSQDCDMRAKFFANIKIVIPAAILALALYSFFSGDISYINNHNHLSYWLVLPYLLVIVLAILGVNVVLVLFCGIVSAMIAGICKGESFLDLCYIAGSGVESVGSLTIITLLAAGMLGIIKEAGGINFILKIIGRNISSVRGAQASIVLLVGIVNLCTANNTVAIITVGTLAKNISSHFHIPSRKTASLLDTGSCVVQSLLPYGAQTLMATSLAGISPVAPWIYLFYPQALIFCLIISIMVTTNKKRGLK